MAYLHMPNRKPLNGNPGDRFNSLRVSVQINFLSSGLTASERFQGYLERHLVLVEVFTQKEKTSVVSC